MKNSFIAFALCMVGGQVHGVSSNNDSTQILSNMRDKNMLVGDMTDLSCEYTTITMGDANLPVVYIKKDKTVVAARIDDNRKCVTHKHSYPPCSCCDLSYDAQVGQLISYLQRQHGTQVPIHVHTPHRKPVPHRQPVFYRVTGKLYSDAENVTVYESHDLDMYIKPGGTLATLGHSGQLGTNAGDIRLTPNNDVTMICNHENKRVDISTTCIIKFMPMPYGNKPVTVKLDNFQGELIADGPQITVKVQNTHCGSVTIREAKALFDHTTITGGGHYGVCLSDHASLVLCGSNVKGPIKGTSNSDVFKVDSTGTVRALELRDGVQQCGDYTVFSEGNVVHDVLDLMGQEIASKNHDTQKVVDTVRKFDATWAKCQMSNTYKPNKYQMPNQNADASTANFPLAEVSKKVGDRDFEPLTGVGYPAVLVKKDKKVVGAGINMGGYWVHGDTKDVEKYLQKDPDGKNIPDGTIELINVQESLDTTDTILRASTASQRDDRGNAGGAQKREKHNTQEESKESLSQDCGESESELNRARFIEEEELNRSRFVEEELNRTRFVEEGGSNDPMQVEELGKQQEAEDHCQKREIGIDFEGLD